MATLGKYELLRPLASGGMAELFLARQPGLRGFEKQVVLKRLHQRFAGDEAVVRMFIDEARIAAQLSHTNIVQIYDLGESEGSYFIAMEYVDGRNLREIQEKEAELGRRIPYWVTAHVISRICRGLHHAHTLQDGQGRPLSIVHRDVSPQNVMVSFDGEVKLADFGIAKAASRAAETVAGVLKGKVAYMSPEQVESKAVDARSDVFAAGILLYELTCRRRLFRRNSDFATMRAVVKDPIPPPSAVADDIPDELEEVIMHALARNPDERYPDAQQMQEALEQAIRATGAGVDTPEVAAIMGELFAAELRRVEAGEAIIPAGVDEETMAEIAAPAPAPASPSPSPSPRPGRPAGPAPAFIDAPTVVGPQQPSLAVPAAAALSRGSDPGDDQPTSPVGPRLQPEAAFIAAMEAVTDEAEPDDGATQIRRPDFDDIIDDPDLLQEVDEETAPGPPTAAAELHVVAPGPAPAQALSPASTAETMAAGPAAIAGSAPSAAKPTPEPAAPRPRSEAIRQMPTVAAVAAAPPTVRRPPRALVALVLLLLVVSALAVLGVFLWKRGILGPRREAVVQVTSKPGGAVVYLDGEKRFGLTPISLYGVSVERSHQLVVALDGFEPWRKMFTLDRDATSASYSAQLKRSRPGGAPAVLVIRVDQPEAQVYLDGVKQGTAPITLDRVASGVGHTLVIKKDGFDDGVLQVQTLAPGERRKVQITLAPTETKLIKGVEKPKKGLPGGPVVLPPRGTIPPLRDSNLGERLPGK